MVPAISIVSVIIPAAEVIANAGTTPKPPVAAPTKELTAIEVAAEPANLPTDFETFDKSNKSEKFSNLSGAIEKDVANSSPKVTIDGWFSNMPALEILLEKDSLKDFPKFDTAIYVLP